MRKPRTGTVELTYALGAVSRLTGLSPELLRAWERRYAVVEPLRSPGGTRRYRAEDLERLRLVKAAVDAGHRIGNVASLDSAALRAIASPAPELAPPPIDAVLEGLEQLDGAEAHRLLSLQLAALGPARFARDVAAPLLREIGERWARAHLGIASEHLASAILRSLLGAALQPSAASLRGPCVAFATLPGERHELGLQMAALTALGAGANPLYLGIEVPVEDLRAAACRCGAAAVALSIVAPPSAPAEHAIAALRSVLPGEVHVWAGGAGAASLASQPGVEPIDGLEELERRVARLGFERTREARG